MGMTDLELTDDERRQLSSLARAEAAIERVEKMLAEPRPPRDPFAVEDDFSKWFRQKREEEEREKAKHSAPSTSTFLTRAEADKRQAISEEVLVKIIRDMHARFDALEARIGNADKAPDEGVIRKKRWWGK